MVRHLLRCRMASWPIWHGTPGCSPVIAVFHALAPPTSPRSTIWSPTLDLSRRDPVGECRPGLAIDRGAHRGSLSDLTGQGEGLRYPAFRPSRREADLGGLGRGREDCPRRR